MIKYIILIMILLTSVANAEEIRYAKYRSVEHFYDRGNDCYVFLKGYAGGTSCVKRVK